MTKRADLAQKQAADAEEMVRDFQRRLQGVVALEGIEPVSINGRNLEISRPDPQVQHGGRVESRDAGQLNKQIEEAKKRPDVQIAEDPVLKDLETMLVISQERVAAAEKLVAAGQAS